MLADILNLLGRAPLLELAMRCCAPWKTDTIIVAQSAEARPSFLVCVYVSIMTIRPDFFVVFSAGIATQH